MKKTHTILRFHLTVLLSILPILLPAQNITQVLRGTVIDQETHLPLPGASILLMNVQPQQGTVTDENGNFTLRVPIGRVAVQISFLGYEPVSITGIIVNSARETAIHIELKESTTQLGAVEVIANNHKEKPLNTMAAISVRQLSVEEASRYAGGFDDPARLASVFAGSSSTMGNNGIVIRGNAPSGLLWRMEGVEISNPSHFANVTTFGAGGITALSAQMLANSDFYTSAFPAEFGNALSGVFDLKLRNGNNEKFEHTISLGTIGTDIASEGPLGKAGKASYLFNYRYSAFALLAPLLPEDAGGVSYQDFSLKINVPTKKAGTLSLWGLGANDRSGTKAEKDSNLWFYDQDRENSRALTSNGVLGLSHKLILGKRGWIQTSLATSGNNMDYNIERKMKDQSMLPYQDMVYKTWKYTLTSVVNIKISPRFTSRTGFNADQIFYNLHLKQDTATDETLSTLVDSKGNSQLWRIFSQSKYEISHKMTIMAGLDLLHFALNQQTTLEPRLTFSWQLSPNGLFTLGYGLHSQLSMLNFYFISREHPGGYTYPNKHLKFTKAHHLVAGYDYNFSAKSHLKTELYAQFLRQVPVIPGSSYSMLNLDKDFLSDSLTNRGSGTNYGIDLTYERFLNQGFYYLATLSLFNSSYRGGDGIERNTRYNRKFVCNLLGGKEWKTGRNQNNRISVNGRLNFTGGNWVTPVDQTQSLSSKKIVYRESAAFSQQIPGIIYADASIAFIRNKKQFTSTWSLKLMNLFFRKEFQGYRYNEKNHSIDKEEELTMVPNLSYKIDF